MIVRPPNVKVVGLWVAAERHAYRAAETLTCPAVRRALLDNVATQLTQICVIVAWMASANHATATYTRPAVMGAVAISSIVKNVQMAYARDATPASSAALARHMAHVVITAKVATQIITVVCIILIAVILIKLPVRENVATLTNVKLVWMACACPAAETLISAV